MTTGPDISVKLGALDFSNPVIAASGTFGYGLEFVPFVCKCRKPSPLIINQLCQDYNIDKSLSYMVGDRITDIIAGASLILCFV